MSKKSDDLYKEYLYYKSALDVSEHYRLKHLFSSKSVWGIPPQTFITLFVVKTKTFKWFLIRYASVRFVGLFVIFVQLLSADIFIFQEDFFKEIF